MEEAAFAACGGAYVGGGLGVGGGGLGAGLGGAEGAAGARGGGERVGLVDDGGGGDGAGDGGGDLEGELAGGGIGLEAVADRLAFGVGDGAVLGEGVEGAACSVGTADAGEDDDDAGDGLVVLVFNLDDGLAGGALLDVVEGFFAFEDVDVEHEGGTGGLDGGGGLGEELGGGKEGEDERGGEEFAGDSRGVVW